MIEPRSVSEVIRLCESGAISSRSLDAEDLEVCSNQSKPRIDFENSEKFEKFSVNPTQPKTSFSQRQL